MLKSTIILAVAISQLLELATSENGYSRDVPSNQLQYPGTQFSGYQYGNEEDLMVGSVPGIFFLYRTIMLLNIFLMKVFLGEITPPTHSHPIHPFDARTNVFQDITPIQKHAAKYFIFVKLVIERTLFYALMEHFSIRSF